MCLSIVVVVVAVCVVRCAYGGAKYGIHGATHTRSETTQSTEKKFHENTRKIDKEEKYMFDDVQWKPEKEQQQQLKI